MRPPPLAIWLLSQRLSDEWREFVIGDLEEEFATRAARSRFAARAWFWWQTMRSLVAPPDRQSHHVEEVVQGDSAMTRLFADIRYALRVMTRTPSFAFAIVTVLALGIGANTAIFTLVNTVLLRPLPFEEPERLARIFTRTPGGRPFELSPGKFYSWLPEARSFEHMAIYRFRQLALSGEGGARAIEAGAVGAGFFDVVRAQPARGRVFRPEEDAPDARYVAVVSDRFWKAELQASPDVIGRTVRLDDETYTIVGVMPPEASVAAWPAMACEIWIPLALPAEQRSARGNHYLQGVARLRPGVELTQARSELEAITARLGSEFPGTDKGWGGDIIRMQDDIVGDSRTILIMLLGAVGLVLLVACANVGNLLFTRALNRRKEIAIRSALGAGRLQVFQQLFVEALLLATAGGAMGVLLAHAALTSASSLLASQVPRAAEISFDARVLMFAVAVSMLTGILAGTLPAIRVVCLDLNDALKEGGRAEGALGTSTRRVLIVCEVALSMVLLMGAGVMVRSLVALKLGDAGFNPNNVLTMVVTLVPARYQTPAQVAAFFETALQRVRALPGVEAAGTVDDLPLLDGSSQTLRLDGYPPDASPVAIQVRQISPGYLRTLGIPVIRGRDLVEHDSDVLLVSAEAATLYWGADDPIGRRASLPFSRTVLREVVGIVGDVKQRSLTEPTTPTVYFYTREPYRRATLALRTSVPSGTLIQPTLTVIRDLDPDQPVQEIRTMVEVVDEKLTPQRFSAQMLGAFAAVALVLAAVGIYSVLSYIVRGRSREIAIRRALGARASEVLRLVLVESMTPTVVGIAVGAIAALGLARVLDTLVFGVSASDWVTAATVAVTLACAALAASLVPAYRALRLDPVNVLRAG